eukprot:g8035.t1
MADFEASQDENDAIVLVLVFLLFYIFPASLYFLYKLCSGTCSLCCQQDESKRKTKSGGFRKCEYLNLAIYVLLCGIFYAYLQKVEPVSDLNDPFEILGVSSSASKRKIKKAYRKLALAHHPDKGGDVKKFREIHDAYRTLTNPVAKRNWQLHGHPDGPQMYRVKVLPLLYTEDGAQGPLLFVYLIFVIGLPTTCYCYCFSPSLQDKKRTELMIRLSQAFRKNIKRSNVNIFNIVSTVTSSLAVTDTLSDDNQEEDAFKHFKKIAMSYSLNGGKQVEKSGDTHLSDPEVLAILHLHRREKNVCSLFDDKEDTNAKKLSMSHHNLLGQILLDTYTILLKMLGLSIKNRWLTTTQTIGKSAGYFAQGFSPYSTMSIKDIMRIQKEECNYPLPEMSLTADAFVLDEDEIGCGDYITCHVNLVRGVAPDGKESLRNGVTMSTFLGVQPDFEKNPGVASVYLKGTQIGSIEEDPAREEMWLVTVGIPATDYLVGASIVKNVDKKKLVKFTFTAPEEPCKMTLEVKAINLNHCHCEITKTVVKDVVDIDEDDDDASGESTAGNVSDGVEDDLPSGMDTDDEDENDDFVEKE